MADEFPFNDEFLLQEDQFKRAQERYPDLMFALYNETIFKDFKESDDEALASKKRLQNFGFVTVLLAFLALALAALDIAVVVHHSFTIFGFPGGKMIAVIAAVFGLASFIIGFVGAGLGKVKDNALKQRMVCERIRQWRWRYFLQTLPMIVRAINGKEQEDYKEAWESDYFKMKGVLTEYRDTVYRGTISGGENFDTSNWEELIPDQTTTAELEATTVNQKDAHIVEDAFDAYAYLRIRCQLLYADHVVTAQSKIRTHPKLQAQRLEWLSTGALLVVVFLHILVTIGVLSDISVLKHPIVHMLTIVSALFALALKAIEGGLRPEQHLGRYAGYAGTMRRLKEEAETADTPYRKLRVSEATEQAAFDEMKEFLVESEHAKFIM